ncbi:hypothetical protein CONLIGDRAFT_125333 [Coniochaeta ligniaria NRRL 30616]|uniref:Uncharacterized protein n=1 Tax=Coniochaeta ligniaria NRRL 30616 TaxID=1408157 RepID=A0A1J7ISK9_9PEZI|nr:hypothetical protein CONLIGDRAFT_125333 [Coniochaeta ligniaria NRRL 30616]
MLADDFSVTVHAVLYTGAFASGVPFKARAIIVHPIPAYLSSQAPMSQHKLRWKPSRAEVALGDAGLYRLSSDPARKQALVGQERPRLITGRFV